MCGMSKLASGRKLTKLNAEKNSFYWALTFSVNCPIKRNILESGLLNFSHFSPKSDNFQKCSQFSQFSQLTEPRDTLVIKNGRCSTVWLGKSKS